MTNGIPVYGLQSLDFSPPRVNSHHCSPHNYHVSYNSIPTVILIVYSTVAFKYWRQVSISESMTHAIEVHSLSSQPQTSEYYTAVLNYEVGDRPPKYTGHEKGGDYKGEDKSRNLSMDSDRSKSEGTNVMGLPARRRGTFH